MPTSCLCVRMTSLCALVQPVNSLKNRSLYRLECFEAQGLLLPPVLQSWLRVLYLLLTPLSYVQSEWNCLLVLNHHTMAHSSATASHPRRSEKLIWTTMKSLPSSCLMTRGETPVVMQPPFLCRIIKRVFLRTPRRTICSFMYYSDVYEIWRCDLVVRCIRHVHEWNITGLFAERLLCRSLEFF